MVLVYFVHAAFMMRALNIVLENAQEHTNIYTSHSKSYYFQEF